MGRRKPSTKAKSHKNSSRKRSMSDEYDSRGSYPSFEDGPNPVMGYTIALPPHYQQLPFPGQHKPPQFMLMPPHGFLPPPQMARYQQGLFQVFPGMQPFPMQPGYNPNMGVPMPAPANEAYHNGGAAMGDAGNPNKGGGGDEVAPTSSLQRRASQIRFVALDGEDGTKAKGSNDNDTGAAPQQQPGNQMPQLPPISASTPNQFPPSQQQMQMAGQLHNLPHMQMMGPPCGGMPPPGQVAYLVSMGPRRPGGMPSQLPVMHAQQMPPPTMPPHMMPPQMPQQAQPVPPGFQTLHRSQSILARGSSFKQIQTQPQGAVDNAGPTAVRAAQLDAEAPFAADPAAAAGAIPSQPTTSILARRSSFKNAALSVADAAPPRQQEEEAREERRHSQQQDHSTRKKAPREPVLKSAARVLQEEARVQAPAAEDAAASSVKSTTSLPSMSRAKSCPPAPLQAAPPSNTPPPSTSVKRAAPSAPSSGRKKPATAEQPSGRGDPDSCQSPMPDTTELRVMIKTEQQNGGWQSPESEAVAEATESATGSTAGSAAGASGEAKPDCGAV